MKLKLVKKINEARDTKSFFFEAEEDLIWIPGQYIYITLPKLNYSDERGNTRHFTISSSPSEGNLIRVTVRVRQESGYKKTLDELPIGAITEAKIPQGTFVLDESIKNNIFLAGGIGITPFRSMIKYNIDKNLKIPMHIIYSNSDSEFVFKNELDIWQKNNDFMKVTYFDSSVSGHLDAIKLKTLCSIENNTFWIVGPSAFVSAMEDILGELKVSEDNIKSEKFTGY